MSARAEDARARRRARTEFERPLLLEAGAGTGKTATLTSRVLAWCLGPGWERHDRPGRDAAAVAEAVLSGVTAITFTERAAVEMETLIGEDLDAVSRRKDLPWLPLE